MGGMEDGKETMNVGSDYESVRHKMGVVEVLKLRWSMRIVSRMRLVKLNKLERILKSVFIQVFISFSSETEDILVRVLYV
jgi:hypothetical protein